MRFILWLVALFAVAVGLALLVGANQSTVTLFWAPHRIDVSLNLALLVLFALFVVMHLAWRALSALFHLPHHARRWRLQQKERAMHKTRPCGMPRSCKPWHIWWPLKARKSYATATRACAICKRRKTLAMHTAAKR